MEKATVHEQNHTNGHAETQRFAEAITTANIPTLLMVLVQLTGELHWLEEPYRMDVLKKMLTQGLGAVECRQDVHDAYNERINQAHANMVWTHPGMETYYRNARGRIVVNSPYRNAIFYDMTRAANLGDFVVEPSQS